MLAVTLSSRFMLLRSYSPGMVPKPTWATSRSNIGPLPLFMIGTRPTWLAESIRGGGISTCT